MVRFSVYCLAFYFDCELSQITGWLSINGLPNNQALFATSSTDKYDMSLIGPIEKKHLVSDQIKKNMRPQ